jgi:putative lipoic acid-binding regulatory protein
VQERRGKQPDTAAVLAFPTAFPIKIMGRRESGFTAAVLEIVLRHAPDFRPASVETRPSREGRYLSITATVNATSREQLDALYRELCDHPSVVMVL